MALLGPVEQSDSCVRYPLPPAIHRCPPTPILSFTNTPCWVGWEQVLPQTGCVWSLTLTRGQLSIRIPAFYCRGHFCGVVYSEMEPFNRKPLMGRENTPSAQQDMNLLVKDSPGVSGLRGACIFPPPNSFSQVGDPG